MEIFCYATILEYDSRKMLRNSTKISMKSALRDCVKIATYSELDNLCCNNAQIGLSYHAEIKIPVEIHRILSLRA